MELNTVGASTFRQIYQAVEGEKSTEQAKGSKENGLGDKKDTLTSASSTDSASCLSYITLPFRKVWEGISCFASWIISTLCCCCVSKKFDIDQELTNIKAVRDEIVKLDADKADKNAIAKAIKAALNNMQDLAAFKTSVMQTIAHEDAMKAAADDENAKVDTDEDQAAYVAKFLEKPENNKKYGDQAEKIITDVKKHAKALDGHLKDYADTLTAKKDKAEAEKSK